MLDLQASVHLHEVELFRCSVKDELNSTGIIVAYSLSSSDGSLSHLITLALRDAGGGLFDDLLVSPLKRTIAFMQMNIVSMLVTEDLNFNMAGSFYVFLDNHMIIAKTFHGLTFGSIKLVLEFFLIPDNPHTFATTTEGGL